MREGARENKNKNWVEQFRTAAIDAATIVTRRGRARTIYVGLGCAEKFGAQ